jgi:hypothetical protein
VPRDKQGESPLVCGAAPLASVRGLRGDGELLGCFDAVRRSYADENLFVSGTRLRDRRRRASFQQRFPRAEVGKIVFDLLHPLLVTGRLHK